MGYFFVIAAVLIIVVILYHFCSVMRTGKIIKCTTESETYNEILQKTQSLDRKVANFRRIYREIVRNNQLEQEQKEQLLSEWEKFSLEEVLRANTPEQLKLAKKLAIPGTLAAKFVPIQQEQVSILEVEIAGSNIEKLISVARMAPKGGQAELIAFSKLKRLLSNSR